MKFERLGPGRTWVKLNEEGGGCWTRWVMVCAVVDGTEVGERISWSDYPMSPEGLEHLFAILEARVGTIVAGRATAPDPVENQPT